MRVSKAREAENRARILAAASRLFREQGVAGTGVAALAEAAGLTHGGLYSQFGSKEQLAVEALQQALMESGLATLPPQGDTAMLTKAFARYLSPAHRDAPGAGCAIAALASDMPREGAALRHTFTAAVRERMRRIARLLPGRGRAREDAALALLASLVGALALARAVDDPVLSGRILAAARRRLTAWIEG